jgi:hypothetical protein
MKTFIGIILGLSLLSCDRISAPNESNVKGPTQYRQDEYPLNDSLFYIQNETHVNLGSVGIRFTDSSTIWVNVPDSGVYSTHISKAPVYCLIHSQSVLYSTPEWIKITDSTSVHADWSTNVIIVDQAEVN